jgi:hypothetical protein
MLQSLINPFIGHSRTTTTDDQQRAERPPLKAVDRMTVQISRDDLNVVLHPHLSPFGLRRGAAHSYMPVPLSCQGILGDLIWRIELHGLGNNSEPLGLDICGDTILGRCEGGAAVDVDFEGYGALNCGISRRHAMLRPSRNCLYLLDLSSTNGTFFNAMRLSAGVVHALHDGDTVTLGNFSFEIKLIDWPGLHH